MLHNRTHESHQVYKTTKLKISMEISNQPDLIQHNLK